MKWIARERPRIDRFACPWLIARFILAARGGVIACYHICHQLIAGVMSWRI
jgi:hypothetical protein